MKRIAKWFTDNLSWLIVLAVGALCTGFIVAGTPSENGSITLNGQNAQIEEYTQAFIEDANAALNRIMNEDVPTDEETIRENEDVGLGFSTDISIILSRIEPDGNNDNGLGWQCSKYTAYLATGKREYSTAHTDYGPVNGKDVAAWLVKNYGFKYIDQPVKGAIGSGGWNTTYGHTALYLYSTGTNTAMVNDANYKPLTVATHNMNISGWVWVVPGNYEPSNPTPITPDPDEPIAKTCDKWHVSAGDTMGGIMEACEGKAMWGDAMNDYAKTWFSTIVVPGQSVYDGWISSSGVGLYAGDIIEHR